MTSEGIGRPLSRRTLLAGASGAAALSADARWHPAAAHASSPTTLRWEVVADGLAFPEAPLVLRDGSVVLGEIRTGAITIIDSHGRRRLLTQIDGGPNGIAAGPDGMLYVTDDGGFVFTQVNGVSAPGDQPPNYRGGRILRVNPVTGRASVVHSEYRGRALRGPNDLVFDAAGGFYFTDTGKQRPDDLDQGALYYATIDGTRIDRLVARLSAPNGVALSADGRRLYVSETNSGRLWSWRVVGNGVLADGPVVFNAPPGAALFYRTQGLDGLDSLKATIDGGVAAVRIFGGGDIVVLARDGGVRGVVALPRADPFASNLAVRPGPVTGPQTVYVTSAGLGLLYRCTTWPYALRAPQNPA